MSERWTFQLKSGLIFAFVFTFMMCVMNEKSLEIQFNSTNFYIRILTNILVGVFVIGYFKWKGQDEKNNSWSIFFRNKTKNDLN